MDHITTNMKTPVGFASRVTILKPALGPHSSLLPLVSGLVCIATSSNDGSVSGWPMPTPGPSPPHPSKTCLIVVAILVSLCGFTLWFHCVVSLCGMTMAHVWPILPFLQGLDTSLPRKLLQDLMDVLLVHGAAFNKIMIVQLMLNKWVFNAVMVGTPEPLHGAAQGGVHIKVPSTLNWIWFCWCVCLLTNSLTFLLNCSWVNWIRFYWSVYSLTYVFLSLNQSEPFQCSINFNLCG